ncbi:MAG: hypothetical protein HY054_06480 [Proteobacteria bacterium]|nr:hypothetical protein [Pseudomonadota bacterium]
MQQYEVTAAALAQRAQAERQYMHYALVLAILLTLAGAALIILGLGDHLDIIVTGSGGLGARFINASPGVVLWLVSGAIFWFSKPRRFRATVHHDNSDGAQQQASFEKTIEEAEQRVKILLAHVEGRVEALFEFMDREGIVPHDAQPRIRSVTVQEAGTPKDRGGASFELYQSGPTRKTD